ncbi:superoxide reductase [Methanolobus vulcani]|jgi:superoxide reductase|uniref:Superoxide reductase n=1 Tax=Methanolobus vulcani TaxID=38026 RepID=A0A7Z7AZR6_9EURY|nr:class II SORL domain-containing protein [Methanolobus vulcani]MDK2826873.1 superoxide reductase [Methanolobus sp.]MDK2947162.1 superoxide reductase [Methanolobus sp.]SDF92744.1 superoxide reductase [Methanolobus vulcani]
MSSDINIQTAKDHDNLTEMEKKHVPFIEAPSEVIAGEPFDVKVTVGSVPHVMEEGHYIQWIELYLNGDLVGKEELQVSDEKAEAVFKAVGTEEMISVREIINCTIHGFGVCGTCGTRSAIVNLRAVESCSIHGLWEYSKGIEIISPIVKAGKKCTWGPHL